MRSNKKLSVVALVVLAAGLSLTACDPQGADASSATTPSSSASTPAGGQDSAGSDAGSGAGSDSGSDTGSLAAKNDANVDDDVTAPEDGGAASGSQGSTCSTDNLSMYAAVSPEVAKGGTDVQISNDGKQTCTMKGFPEVDLGNTDDVILHTQAADEPAKLVTLRHGDMAVFHIDYPSHAAPGSDLTEFNELVVTTPGQKYSQTITEIDGGPIALPMDAHVTVSAVD